MTKHRNKRLTFLAAIAVLSVLAVSGCSSDSERGPAPIEGAPFPSQPIQTEVSAPEAQSGSVLTAEEAAEINSSWGRAMDDKAYQMPSGEFVLVKGGQPLPENVEQAIEESVSPPLVATYVTSVFNADNKRAANEAIAAQEAATGRTIALVIHGMNAIGATGEEPRWSTGVQPGYNGTSREEAVAMAQKWVDQSPNTRILLVIDALG